MKSYSIKMGILLSYIGILFLLMTSMSQLLSEPNSNLSTKFTDSTNSNNPMNPLSSAPNYSLVYEQTFNSETVHSNPLGWSVVGTDDVSYMYFKVLCQCSHSPYPTNTMYVSDNQAGSPIYGTRILTRDVNNGKLNFDFYLYMNSQSIELYFILEDASGNDIITILFEDISSSNWHYKVEGQSGPSILSARCINFELLFSDSLIDVKQNDTTVLSGISYGGESIHQIRVLSTSASYGYECCFDYISLYQESDYSIIYQQTFDTEIPGSLPQGWSVTGRNLDYHMNLEIMDAHVVADYPTRGLFLTDNQGGMNIYATRVLDSDVVNGKLDFDIYFQQDTLSVEFYFILEDASGNDIITILFEDVSSSYWRYRVEGQSGPSILTQSYVHLELFFSDFLIDVKQNGTTVLNDISYGGETIHQIRITSTTAAYGYDLVIDYIEVYEAIALAAPTLNTPSNPEHDGDYTISWSSVEDATTYYLFRSATSFSDVTGMTPIYEGSSLSHLEEDRPAGTYYYGVIASNGTKNSSLSNIISIKLGLDQPSLDPISNLGNYDNYTIHWDSVEFATKYYLYRSTSTFTDVTGMTPLYIGSSLSYYEKDRSTGTYYYGVIASNGYYNSSLSSVESTYVAPSPPIDLTGLDSFLVLMVFAVAVLITGIKISKKQHRNAFNRTWN